MMRTPARFSVPNFAFVAAIAANAALTPACDSAVGPASRDAAAFQLLVFHPDIFIATMTGPRPWTAARPAEGLANGSNLIGIAGIAALVILALVAAAILLRRLSAAGPAPRLEVLSGPDKGKVFLIRDEKQLIGRLSTAPIPLGDPSGLLHLSREHARVWKAGSLVHIEDCGSRFGTRVNDRPVTGATVLTNGDVIQMGEIELIFRGPALAAGDLRPTLVDPGAADATVSAGQTDLPPPGDTQSMEKTRLAGLPTVEEDDETRRTRLKTGNGVSARLAPQADIDNDELRRTRLKEE